MKAVMSILLLMWAGIGWSNDDKVPSSEALTISYESAFSNYKSSQDIESADWKMTNEKVMGNGHGSHQTPIPANNPESLPVTPAGEDNKHKHH